MPDTFGLEGHRAAEFRPAFPRYSPECTELLGRIRAALAIVEAVRILPAQEDELRHEALVGTIHYSTLIEGNTLGMVEARRAARGELDGLSRAELELVNYVDALQWIDREHDRGAITYQPQFLLELHRILTAGLGREDTMFKPHHEGRFRDGIAIVGDQLGNVFHEGPPPEAVPGEVAALGDWLEDRRLSPTLHPGPVLAAIAHYRITDIHPFADGNGRLARAFAVAVLEREGYLPHRIFSFERHYAEDRERYYRALRSVRQNTNNHEQWLLYALGGLVEEYERVADRVRVLNRLTTAARKQTTLNRRQEQILAMLTSGERPSIDRAEAQELTGAAERTARNDLLGLAQAGVLRRSAGRRYRLVGAASGDRGRPRMWTDERIEHELRRMMMEIGRFPTATELQRHHTALYRAISRSGGTREWRARLDP